MNCKEGDTALVRFSVSGLEGKIVKCLRFFGYVTGHSVKTGAPCMAPAWEVEPALVTESGKTISILTDAQLRPLFFKTGQDEMLQIAGAAPKGRTK